MCFTLISPYWLIECKICDLFTCELCVTKMSKTKVKLCVCICDLFVNNVWTRQRLSCLCVYICDLFGNSVWPRWTRQKLSYMCVHLWFVCEQCVTKMNKTKAKLYMCVRLWFVCEQRVTKMNKTEDDELDTNGLTEAELRQVAGQYTSWLACLQTPFTSVLWNISW